MHKFHASFWEPFARDLNALEIGGHFGFLTKYQSTFLLDSNLNCSILWDLKIVLQAHYSLILDHSALELFPRLEHSVKIQEFFYFSQIFREINLPKSKVLKKAILTVLVGLNYAFLAIKNGQISSTLDNQSLQMVKMAISEPLDWLKLISRKNSDREIFKFPHCVE